MFAWVRMTFRSRVSTIGYLVHVSRYKSRGWIPNLIDGTCRLKPEIRKYPTAYR